MSKTRILTGITTTGTPHLGNFAGAIGPAIEATRQNPDAEFFLIIGLDNVEPINHWMEADEIFKLTQLLVAPRDAAIADRDIIAKVLPKGARFGIIDCPGGGISSTIIRNWIMG